MSGCPDQVGLGGSFRPASEDFGLQSGSHNLF